MNPPKTLWKLERHTLGKHLVLRNYLDAWFPIMSRFNKRILFIDGFAGPGQYKNGEDGSPIIALNTLKQHHSKLAINADITFAFIENNRARANHLRSLIGDPSHYHPRCKVQVVEGAFNDTLTQILDQIDSQATQLELSFVMIDPFGVSDTPMSIIKRILCNPKSEVFVSFMYEAINRFKKTPEFESHLDELFGSPNWREGIAIKDPLKRKSFFYSLYEQQLRSAGAKHVVHFELYKSNRLIYSIFFATKHHTGCDRMKQAIWKVAPLGDFAFKSTRLGHQPIFDTDFEPLKEALTNQFGGKGWVTIEAILAFVASDKTDYYEAQTKTNALRPLEDSGQLLIDPNTRKRKGTYPDGTKLRFA